MIERYTVYSGPMMGDPTGTYVTYADHKRVVEELSRELNEVRMERDEERGCVSVHEGIEDELLAQLAELRERVEAIDPAKLRLLADWFDTEEVKGRWGGVSNEVQRELRGWADTLAALSPKGGKP